MHFFNEINIPSEVVIPLLLACLCCKSISVWWCESERSDNRGQKYWDVLKSSKVWSSPVLPSLQQLLAGYYSRNERQKWISAMRLKKPFNLIMSRLYTNINKPLKISLSAPTTESFFFISNIHERHVNQQRDPKRPAVALVKSLWSKKKKKKNLCLDVRLQKDAACKNFPRQRVKTLPLKATGFWSSSPQRAEAKRSKQKRQVFLKTPAWGEISQRGVKTHLTSSSCWVDLLCTFSGNFPLASITGVSYLLYHGNFFIWI